MEISIFTLIKYSVQPMAVVLTMCAVGFLLALPQIGILHPSGRHMLSQLVFLLFLPCLIFTQLGKVVTLQKMLLWWFIPVNVFLSCFLGCLMGVIVVLLVRPPKELVKFTIVMTGICNIGNIPFVLVGAVCGDKSNPFGDSESCNDLGMAYISFGQWIGAVVVYTFGYHMLAPPVDLRTLKIPIDLEIESNSSTPLLAEGEDKSNSTANNSSVCSKIWYVLGLLGLKEILQPPVLASIIALIVGAIPFLKQLIIANNAPLYFFDDGLYILGQATIPCIMLVLGGNLVGGPGNSKLNMSTLVAITFVRLCIAPIIGYAIVSWADQMGFLPPDDKMFRFVLLMQHTMPTAILAGAVASLRGYAEQEASAVLFWGHIAAIFALTGWLMVYFNYIF